MFRSNRIAKLLRRGWIEYASDVPENAIPVDPDKINLGNSYDRPTYYKDVEFKCQDCGSEERWKAEDQLWYYETVGGYFFSSAIRCRACRKKEAARKAEARKTAGHGEKEIPE